MAEYVLLAEISPRMSPGFSAQAQSLIDSAMARVKPPTVEIKLDNRQILAGARQAGKDAGIAIAAGLASSKSSVDRALGSLNLGQALNRQMDVSPGISRVNTQLRGINNNVRVAVDVDDKGSSGRAASGMMNVLGTGMKFGGMIPAIAGAGAALAALAPAAAIGAGGIAVAAFALQGIGEAYSAMSSAQSSAGADAQASAMRQAQAAAQITSAQEQVSSAVRNLDNARRSAAQGAAQAARQVEDAETQLVATQREALRAQEALTDAREAARRSMEDLALQVQEGSLSQRQAVLDLQDAERDLLAVRANPSASKVQQEQADIAFERARVNLERLKVSNKRLAEEKAQSDAQGVEGSDEVTTAQERIQSTQERVRGAAVALGGAFAAQAEQQRTATQSIEDAQQGVISAQRSLDQALMQSGDVGSAAMNKVNEAMAKLSPAGREFATFLFGLKPVFDQLQASAAGGFLPGLQSGMQAMLPVVPVISQVIGQFASAMGDMARVAGETLASPFWVEFFTMLGNNAGPIMRQMSEVFWQFAQIAAQLLTDLMPLAPVALQMVSAFGQWVGILLPAIMPLIDVLTHGLLSALMALMPAAQPLGDALSALAGPAAELLVQIAGLASSLMSALLPVFVELAPPLTSLIQLLGTSLIQIVQMLAPIIAQLVPPLAQVAEMLVGGLSQAVQMVMPYLGQIVEVLGNALVSVLASLMPLFPTLIDAFLSILGAVLPLIDPLIQLVLAILPPLIDLIPTLVPIIQLWANMLALIMPQLTPIIAALIEHLIPIINDLMGVISAVFPHIAEIVTWVLGSVVVPLLTNVVLPAIRLLGDVIGWLLDHIVRPVFNLLGDVIKWVWEHVVRPVFEALKGGVENIGKVFESTIDWISRVWNRMKEIAAVPVNFVIETIYNKGIRYLVNKVAEKLGLDSINLPYIEPVHFAGGGLLPGYAPGKDSILAMLSPGESVLTPEATRAIGPRNILALNAALSGRPPGGDGGFSGGGIAHFAGGGLVGSILGFLGLGDVGAGVERLFTDPDGFVKSAFGDPMPDWTRLAVQAPLSMIGKIPQILWDKITGWMSSSSGRFVSGGGPAGSAQLTQWILAAMGITGVPGSWLGPLTTLIMRESGGNPNAINNWDINAQNGIPSQGLMQTIPPTFAAYRDPSLPNNILDPLANIVAGINYILARYGTIFNVQQAVGATPQGYDSGGLLMPGYTLAFNGTGKPEAVFTSEQLSSLKFSGGPGRTSETRLDAWSIERIAQAMRSRPSELYLDGQKAAQSVATHLAPSISVPGL